MTDCPICSRIAEKKFVYETEDVAVMIPPEPFARGHLIVVPKAHQPIIETVPDFVVGEMFSVANTVSMAVFEGLKAHGTNIVLQNGLPAGQRYPHAAISVIPRYDKDGLPLMWKPKTLGPDDFADIEIKMKEESKSIGPFQKERPKMIEQPREEPPKAEPPKEESKDESEEMDYRIASLIRIP